VGPPPPLEFASGLEEYEEAAPRGAPGPASPPALGADGRLYHEVPEAVRLKLEAHEAYLAAQKREQERSKKAEQRAVAAQYTAPRVTSPDFKALSAAGTPHKLDVRDTIEGVNTVEFSKAMEKVLHAPGFRIVQIDLSAKENLDAEAAARAAGSTREPFEDKVVRVVNHSFADVVVFNGIGSGADSRVDLVEQVTTKLGKGWVASDVSFPRAARRENRMQGRGCQVVVSCPIMETRRLNFGKTGHKQPASGLCLRLSVSPETMLGMQVSLRKDGLLESPQAKGRRQMLWVVAVDVGDESAEVQKALARAIRIQIDLLKGDLPIFVAGSLRARRGENSVLYREVTSKVGTHLIDAQKTTIAASAASARHVVEQFAAETLAQLMVAKQADAKKSSGTSPAKASWRVLAQRVQASAFRALQSEGLEAVSGESKDGAAAAAPIDLHADGTDDNAAAGCGGDDDNTSRVVALAKKMSSNGGEGERDDNSPSPPLAHLGNAAEVVAKVMGLAQSGTGYEIRKGQMDIARETSSFFVRQRATAPARSRVDPPGAEAWAGDFQLVNPTVRQSYIFVHSGAGNKISLSQCRCDKMGAEILKKMELDTCLFDSDPVMLTWSKAASKAKKSI